MSDYRESDLNERIRRRAYELWEQDGRAGDPNDHWHRAERELKEQSRDPLGATVEEVPPADAVRSAEAADPSSPRGKAKSATKSATKSPPRASKKRST
jgi:Protein of unknown function (DUF2934)